MDPSTRDFLDSIAHEGERPATLDDIKAKLSGVSMWLAIIAALLFAILLRS